MAKQLFFTADILLPSQNVDLSRWAVLACDQFTSQPDYWEKADAFVGNAPSTLRMVLPEVYLEEPDAKKRIVAMHKAMEAYKKETLTRVVKGFVYVERDMGGGKMRQGLVGCVDLEEYNYQKGARAQIRPSESTVAQRIPPRLAVRRGAVLESPHILMLIDDVQCKVIEPVEAKKKNLELLYDEKLMLNGGRIKGWAVTKQDDIEEIIKEIERLQNEKEFCEKYGTEAGEPVFTMAVGDGNHSLATAKAHWEELKQDIPEAERENHPARYCLIELENVQSPAIEIEPIHRVLFGLNPKNAADEFKKFLKRNTKEKKGTKKEKQVFRIVVEGKSEEVVCENSPLPIAAATAEAFIEEYISNNKNIIVDYVHGQEAVEELAKNNAFGILLPPFEKGDLFRGVALGGVLPRKTFSMGHAHQKRYYMECRKIMK